MAVRHILVERPVKAVWSVLGDPTSYAAWVPGTSKSGARSGHWPDVGSTLRYTARLGPIGWRGHTSVRICQAPQRLELEAFAGALGSARIAIEVVPWGEHAFVVVDEHPLRGAGGRLHSAPLDLLLHLRHRRLLTRLARLVEDSC